MEYTGCTISYWFSWENIHVSAKYSSHVTYYMPKSSSFEAFWGTLRPSQASKSLRMLQKDFILSYFDQIHCIYRSDDSCAPSFDSQRHHIATYDASEVPTTCYSAFCALFLCRIAWRKPNSAWKPAVVYCMMLHISHKLDWLPSRSEFVFKKSMFFSKKNYGRHNDVFGSEGVVI